MKIIDSQGQPLMDATLAVNGEGQLCTHTVLGGACDLDMPKLDVSFESQKDGLLVHLGLAGADKSCDVLVEYADVKALREVPGKGLVSFALKAFR